MGPGLDDQPHRPYVKTQGAAVERNFPGHGTVAERLMILP
jgi:hypothetical protein